MNDWPLIEKIASTRRPVIVSSGGASEKDLDDIVSFLLKEIFHYINHCVSLIHQRMMSSIWIKSIILKTDTQIM